MKRVIIILLSVVLCLSVFHGCSNSVTPTGNEGTKTTQDVSGEKTESPETEAPIDTAAPGVTEPSGTAYEIVYKHCTVYKNSIGTTWVHVVVQIENTGSDTLYISSSSVDLEDANEHLVDTITLASVYPQVLKSGETALLVEDTTLDEDPGTDELTVLPHLEINKAKVDCIRYETSEEELFESEYSGIKMKGRVKNTSEEAEGMIYVVVNLYDAEHHGIGQLFTILSNELQPGDKIGFELGCLAMPESITLDSIASYEVFAFPLQYQF